MHLNIFSELNAIRALFLMKLEIRNKPITFNENLIPFISSSLSAHMQLNLIAYHCTLFLHQCYKSPIKNVYFVFQIIKSNIDLHIFVIN